MCGDVSPNPGPVKFCHLNARSLLAGVDLEQHMDDQQSLLYDIYEALVYTNDFDIIAISETWLKDNVREDALDLAGYQKPIYKNRASRGGGVMLYQYMLEWRIFKFLSFQACKITAVTAS